MRLNIILQLGSKLQYLKRADYLLPTVMGETYVYENVRVIEKYITELGLNGPIIFQLSLMKGNLEKYKEGEKISVSDAAYIREKAMTLIELLASKLSEILNFQVIEDCSLDKGNLIKLMNSEICVFFEEHIWEKVSEIGKSDFSDAAKCLLIGAPTPATMITMRAAEEILRAYYTFKTENDPGRKAWGTLTDELKRVPDIDESLIGHLDYLRITHRNVAQHPNKIFTQREAERIFMEIIPTVHTMCSEIEI